MDILKRPTLVLNRNWVPISTVPVQTALTMLFGDFTDDKGRKLPKARILDVDEHNNVQIHTWDSWKELPVSDNEPFLRTSHEKHRVPEIVIATRYQHLPKNQGNFNQRNLFRRDDCCQYCGGHGNTIDHVLPRSKGGKSTWENCVACCFACNQKKRDRTPEEANMTLLRTPCKPGLELLGQSKVRLKSWAMFFKG